MGTLVMTTVYTSVTVTGQDGEPVELELEVTMYEGEVPRLQMLVPQRTPHPGRVSVPVPADLMRQIDMRDLADDVLLKLQARERGWP